MRSRNRSRHMTMRSGVPAGILGRSAQVTMIGKEYVLLEGHRGVVELSQSRIRLRTGDGVVSVLGSMLQLQELSLDTALICGKCAETVTYSREGRV